MSLGLVVNIKIEIAKTRVSSLKAIPKPKSKPSFIRAIPNISKTFVSPIGYANPCNKITKIERITKNFAKFDIFFIGSFMIAIVRTTRRKILSK
jgi:hypothetical protein